MNVDAIKKDKMEALKKADEIMESFPNQLENNLATFMITYMVSSNIPINEESPIKARILLKQVIKVVKKFTEEAEKMLEADSCQKSETSTKKSTSHN